MRIGYFITQLPYKNPLTGELIEKTMYGGVENVGYNLAVQMMRKDHEIDIFTSSMNSVDSIEKYSNLKIHRFANIFMIGSAPISLKLLYSPLKYDIDVVHAHAGNPPATISAYIYAKNKRKPLIITYHGDGRQWNWGSITRRVSVYFYTRYIIEKLLSYADIIISPSERYIRESQILQKYKDKISVIPNGVNIDEFDIQYSKYECREMLSLSNDDKIILFLSSLTPLKGPDILLKAMTSIIKKIPKAKLIIAGKGPMREDLEKLSKKLMLDRHVKFVGFLENEKSLYYRASDIFCLPTRDEMAPLVNLEAMASGIPIVASDVGGIPDIIKNGENGLLVKSKNEEDLANTIIKLLHDDVLTKKIINNGRMVVKEKYSWEKIADIIERIYKNYEK